MRSDGTFSVRIHLPDGPQAIPVEAVSADHADTRTITPTVARATEGAPPAEKQSRAADRKHAPRT